MDAQFLVLVAIGFVAQMVDGALGMAFGVTASSSLMAIGVSPAIASATIHAAEVVTTALSGASHIWNKNVDRKLFFKLAAAGVCGGAVGAHVLTDIPGHAIKPLVAIYLAAMAGLIFARIRGWTMTRWQPPASIIGAVGGLLDAIGGGGWGPLVSSILIARGDHPRHTIGSVNLAEFFVTVSVSVMFLTRLDLAGYEELVLGLIVGGALAAPVAGYLLRIMPTRLALILVGIVVAGLSLMNLMGLLLSIFR